MEKNRITAGADENTPSHAEYFSWINNTNEGSTEKQTLVNLRYFGWLKKKYGMKLDIYAWDAGNLDGATGTYGGSGSAKLKDQYPDGYGRVTDFAKELGIRMGVWCGPDGFGNTPEEEKARFDFMTGLAKDYGFALFKIDTVCGELREEKTDTFIRMMQECRKAVPDFVLLNHRQNMGRAEAYATTFLWEGMETYVDVFFVNGCTAFHNRAGMFTRGNVPGLKRLTEDHGVCISSSIDYFEDDMIYQAFGRCLILAPEIYGNPWLMRDDEQAHMARIFNLHATYADILTSGILLPESYGCNAVSRGNGSTRFIVTGNNTWRPVTIKIYLDEQIGLEKCGHVCVCAHHPYECFVGSFAYGETVEVKLLPFRAALIEISASEKAPVMLTNCQYQVIHETNSKVDKVKILSACGKITYSDGTETGIEADDFDYTTRLPVKLTSLFACDIPAESEALFEATHYAMDNDSLEYRSLVRSGKTSVPEVQAARDEFFMQKTYLARGCDSRFAFDGDPDTFFDGYSKLQNPWMMFGNDCLRVDFGSVQYADEVVFECFDPDDPAPEAQKQIFPEKGDYSADLSCWKDFEIGDISVIKENEAVNAVFCGIHNIVVHHGKRKEVTYPIHGDIRYFRLPGRLDRIYRVSLMRDGIALSTPNAKITNILPSFRSRHVTAAKRGNVNVCGDAWQPGCFIAVTVEGVCGNEGAYATAVIDGKPIGFGTRAPCFPSDAWETPPSKVGGFYTYFLTLTEEMLNKDIEIYLQFMTEHNDIESDVWLCYANDEKPGIIYSM